MTATNIQMAVLTQLALLLQRDLPVDYMGALLWFQQAIHHASTYRNR